MGNDRERFEEIVRPLQRGDPETMEAVRETLRGFAAPAERDETSPEPGKDWYVLRVELMSGRSEDLDPPPGRDVLVSRQHTFRQLAELINQAFARWDLGHLYVFRLADGTEVGPVVEDLPFKEAARTKIAKRAEGEVFEYEFDFGDTWLHRGTFLEVSVEPENVYGVRPKGPRRGLGLGRDPGPVRPHNT